MVVCPDPYSQKSPIFFTIFFQLKTQSDFHGLTRALRRCRSKRFSWSGFPVRLSTSSLILQSLGHVDSDQGSIRATVDSAIERILRFYDVVSRIVIGEVVSFAGS